MAKTTPTDPRYQGAELYRRLFRYVTQQRQVIVFSLVGYVIFAATAPATTWWLGWTVDALGHEQHALIDRHVRGGLLDLGGDRVRTPDE